MKSPKSIFKAFPIAAALFFVGCSSSVTDIISGADETTQAESRGVWNGWDWAGQITGGTRDIAVYENAYVVSADGKSVYVKTSPTGSFSKMTEDASAFRYDPIVSIDAGGKIVKNMAWCSLYFQGVYVTTESKKIYALMYEYSANYNGRSWYEVTNGASAAGIGVRENGRFYAFTDQGTVDKVIYNELAEMSNGWRELYRMGGVANPGDIAAMDCGSNFAYSWPGSNHGTYVLRKNNTVGYLMTTSSSKGHYFATASTPGVVPTKDITVSYTTNGAFATFDKLTNTIYYLAPGQTPMACQAGGDKISLSKDGYLWKLDGSTVYRTKID